MVAQKELGSQALPPFTLDKKRKKKLAEIEKWLAMATINITNLQAQ